MHWLKSELKLTLTKCCHTFNSQETIKVSVHECPHNVQYLYKNTFQTGINLLTILKRWNNSSLENSIIPKTNNTRKSRLILHLFLVLLALSDLTTYENLDQVSFRFIYFKNSSFWWTENFEVFTNNTTLSMLSYLMSKFIKKFLSSKFSMAVI